MIPPLGWSLLQSFNPFLHFAFHSAGTKAPLAHPSDEFCLVSAFLEQTPSLWREHSFQCGFFPGVMEWVPSGWAGACRLGGVCVIPTVPWLWKHYGLSEQKRQLGHSPPSTELPSAWDDGGCGSCFPPSLYPQLRLRWSSMGCLALGHVGIQAHGTHWLFMH